MVILKELLTWRSAVDIRLMSAGNASELKIDGCPCGEPLPRQSAGRVQYAGIGGNPEK
ncbi:MAG: hypothetical protein V2I40_09540 [Desulfobacteraceae bacterium]|nr:hypothetical protein [Desulfobacteraceae bacterium]